METLSDTIKARDNQYGDYTVQAAVAQSLKEMMQHNQRLHYLPADMRESLEMIATKISRILCGNCNNVDNWHDIAGYATLIENRLRKANAQGQSNPPASSSEGSQPPAPPVDEIRGGIA